MEICCCVTGGGGDAGGGGGGGVWVPSLSLCSDTRAAGSVRGGGEGGGEGGGGSANGSGDMERESGTGDGESVVGEGRGLRGVLKLCDGEVGGGDGLERISPAGPILGERTTALHRFGVPGDGCPCDSMWSAIDAL